VELNSYSLRESKQIMSSAGQFESIVSEHYEALFRFAISLTRVESDARDLTQQTFLVWATKGHQLRDITKVKTWLFTTMHRAFLAAHRRQIRYPQHDLADFADELPTPTPEPADLADYSQVLPALARVDEVYQAAVTLFYLEDCSYKEIAIILDVPIGTVKSRLARGIAQLREILLLDSSDACSLNRGENSCRTNASGSAIPLENTLPHPCLHARLATGLITSSQIDGSGFKDSSKPSEFNHPRRILIAEDDELIRQIISEFLVGDGYVVNAAADGEEAWEALRHDAYDLLVTDNSMPRLTGIKLIERIRNAGMSLPVIVASSSFFARNLREYPHLHIAAVIPKPFEKSEFLDAVKNVLL
jgi:RNA polymerase sigma factor (sigma-70 family)